MRKQELEFWEHLGELTNLTFLSQDTWVTWAAFSFFLQCIGPVVPSATPQGRMQCGFMEWNGGTELSRHQLVTKVHTFCFLASRVTWYESTS